MFMHKFSKNDSRAKNKIDLSQNSPPTEKQQFFFFMMTYPVSFLYIYVLLLINAKNLLENSSYIRFQFYKMFKQTEYCFTTSQQTCKWSILYWLRIEISSIWTSKLRNLSSNSDTRYSMTILFHRLQLLCALFWF
jgi:hypothetical protein